MTSSLRTVTVLGTGVLGSQIAFQAAYSGWKVTAYDIDDAAVAAAGKRLDALSQTYATELTGATGNAAAARASIIVTSDLAHAVTDADIVIEAVPEVLDLKRELYGRLAPLLPEHTVLATNSSTFLPSDLVTFTGRPDRFLALHFANQIWKFNTAEIMGTPATDPAVFDQVVEFAGDIGMVAIPIHKEKPGYVLNSLLVPLLNAAGELAAFGYAEPHDIDEVWRIGTGAPFGPFQIYDIIGLTTPYNILAHGDDKDRAIAAWLKENYIDHGKLGLATGEGFYRYPAPDPGEPADA